MENKDKLLDELEQAVLSVVSNTGRLNATLASLQTELQDTEVLLKTVVQQNARNKISQASFEQRYQNYLVVHENLEAENRKLEAKQERRQKLQTQIRLFKECLNQPGELLISFDPELWNAVIDHAVVQSNGGITFVFRHGAEISWQGKRPDSAEVQG